MHWYIKVKVFEVDGAEPCPFWLDKLKRRCVGANVAWVTYAIAPNSDAGAIGVIFLRAHFTNHHGVTDFLLFVGMQVLIVA